MKMNKKLELGINSVSVLKNRETPMPIGELAVTVGTTANFLAQVLRSLRDAGVVEVKRGPGGGYTLVKTTAVTAYTVAKAVGRDFDVLSLDESPKSRLAKAVVEAFENTTI